MTTTIGGYQEYDGRLFPTETTQSMMGMEQVVRLLEPDFSPVDPSAFEPPEAIKTLAAE